MTHSVTEIVVSQESIWPEIKYSMKRNGTTQKISRVKVMTKDTV
jgi:hypothetical protein